MPNVWRIQSGDVSGGATGSNLVGLRIKKKSDNTGYELKSGSDTLSTASNNGSLPTPPFSFTDFPLATYTWTLTVNTLTGGTSQNQAEGTWTNNAGDIKEAEDGSFTAQAGSGADADDNEDAQSASA